MAQTFPATADVLQSSPLNTAITTVGAGTLTAAAVVGGVITRTGPTAAYTDTTDTAAAIIAALENATIGQAWLVTIKNTVPFLCTLAAGASVTLSGQGTIPANSVGIFLVTYNGAGTCTMQGLGVLGMTSPPLKVNTTLTTVGAGTITGAGIAGGLTKRTGSTAAYTDTTDTASAIISARPNMNIGDSFEYTYFNNTLGTATLAGGSGVTVSAITLVPQCTWAKYLVTYTAAGTITIVGMSMGSCVQLPPAKYVTGALQSATFAAGDLTGANVVCYDNTGTTPGNLATRTAAEMFGDIPNCQIGFSYTLLIRNSSGGANTATITAGSNVTLTGTMTIAQNVTRVFNVVFPSATTCTIQSMGLSAAAA